ncbi:chemotaxis response regulator protein-glutamate methylesterase CheB [Desulfocucumis palustris]|uniref:Protein-glutamate methylesterase/protein-glutamine glutaminase n=1 Tax=Desulfocucumis palustris TaxID=1898651 RepID=A0A2L2XG39_9FIRM|nr:chemotaxis response regulator protein-glutamate methylesterase [Desulfocucumis palustris]GBF35110.1 chemotaxis response regulator protein-glutamate methylesterase CheB [Desulfocucumis palustris]
MEQLKTRIKVLVVDDSALVREILAQGLGMDPEIEVVGAASNPYIARDKIVQLKPDVLTLDVEMPRMDGVEFLRRLMPQYPLPVVMVSALTREGAKTTLEALEAGAVDYVTKPSSDIARGLDSMMNKLRQKVKMAATANLREWKEKKTAAAAKLQPVSGAAPAESTDKVIAIGASTGGTRAIRQIIQSFPASMPGVVIVQHMPAGFTKHFADNLNNICEMEVLEASTNDRIMPGRILIAPGGKHMTVKRSGGVYLVECREGDKVNGHCPSVDVLFHSVAGKVGSNAIGIILTGMGHDGADGLLAMRNAGARTLAQDESTSVVFGMPKVAYELGGAEFLQPIDTIPQVIMNLLHEKN